MTIFILKSRFHLQHVTISHAALFIISASIMCSLAPLAIVLLIMGPSPLRSSCLMNQVMSLAHPSDYLYWCRAAGPCNIPAGFVTASIKCRFCSKISLGSKIPLHFFSELSSVAAYTSEWAIEQSETTFGLGGFEKSWSLGLCRARSISSSYFVLPQDFTFRNLCCWTSLLGLLLARLDQTL